MRNQEFHKGGKSKKGVAGFFQNQKRSPLIFSFSKTPLPSRPERGQAAPSSDFLLCSVRREAFRLSVLFFFESFLKGFGKTFFQKSFPDVPLTSPCVFPFVLFSIRFAACGKCWGLDGSCGWGGGCGCWGSGLQR